MYDASVAIDFSPLSKIGDSFVAARESARDRALWAQYQAPDDAAPAAPQIAAAGGAATPPAPGRPLSMGQTMANGPTRMAMPPEAFAPLIKQAAAQYGLDEGMFTRQLAQESAFAPDVIDGTRRSSAGAMGVAQFLPGTAKRFGINPLDPAQAIPAAAQYVALNRKLLGNEGFAYAGYNWGEGNVQKWLASGADPARVPAETRDYVQKITGRPIEAWASARGGQGAPQAAQAPQGGATAAPAAQAAQMPAASEAQPAASLGQNPAKRAALIQLLSSSNPATRETARYLLTTMQKDDSWQLADIGGQKAWVNGRTRQVVPMGVPSGDQFGQETGPDGTVYNVNKTNGQRTVLRPAQDQFKQEADAEGNLWSTNVRTGQRTLLQEGLERSKARAAAGAARTDADYEGRERQADKMGLAGEERKHFILNGKLLEPKPKGDEKVTEDERKNRQLLMVTTAEVPRVMQNFDQLTNVVNQGAKRLLPEAAQAFATSEGFQRAQTGVEMIVASYLYSVSGATANPGEVKTQASALMPKPGEKPQQLADKRARIQTMVSAIKERANVKAGLPPGVTAEQAIAEGREHVRKGADPAAVKRKLETEYGIKTDQF